MTLYLARYLLPISARPIEDGALLLDQGRIVAVGRRAELLPGFSGEVVDFGDAVLLPPLVNAHTHLELTHFPRWAKRSGEPGKSATFVDWLLHLIHVKRNLPAAELNASLSDGLNQCLQSGTGAVGDILSRLVFPPDYAASPLHGRVFLEVLGRDPALWGAALDRAVGLLGGDHFGHLQPGLAPHSPYSLSQQAMCTIFAAARRQGWSLTTHFAESPAESQFVQEATGELLDRFYPAVDWQDQRPAPNNCSPTLYLDMVGGLTPQNLLVHGVQVSAEDALLLAERGVTVALCPRSNERLGVGIAPVPLYLAAGVKLALGTDSLASNDSLSMWDELGAAWRCYGSYLNPADLLAMATRNGAEALGLKGEMGTLHTAGGGHFQVLPLVAVPPLAQLEEMLCSQGSALSVKALYLDGIDRLPSA
jgi:cytosine/adenosine deaminase-related metal-dependent hydrolase